MPSPWAKGVFHMEDIMESAVPADTIPHTDEESAGQPAEESATETGGRSPHTTERGKSLCANFGSRATPVITAWSDATKRQPQSETMR